MAHTALTAATHRETNAAARNKFVSLLISRRRAFTNRILYYSLDFNFEIRTTYTDVVDINPCIVSYFPLPPSPLLLHGGKHISSR